MSNPAQIPPEAVEAAAVTLMGRLMVSHNDALHVWSGMYEPEKDQFRREARAALAAALSAWAGAEVVKWYHADQTLILPLPQEARDGERWPHQRIYLEPRDCADPSTGPLWAEHDIGSDNENGSPVAWEPYVKEVELTTLRAENEKLRAALREIADIKSYSEVSKAIKVAAIARTALAQEKA